VAELEEGTIFDDTYYQRIGDALVPCADSYRRQGLDLYAFNAMESAADVEDLRVALGYSQVNLYGVSYGTLVALETLRSYPSAIRSVVLDGVFSPGTDPLVIDPLLALDRIFTACYARPNCAEQFPGIHVEYHELVERLNASPVVLFPADPADGNPEDILLTGDILRNALYQLMYVDGLTPFIPLVVHSAYAGDLLPFKILSGVLSGASELSSGAYWAAYCHIASSAGSTKDQAVACADYLEAEPQTSAGDSAGLPLEQSATASEPVTSDVPVLILNGEYDPVTPPSNGYQVAKTLTHSTVIVVPRAAHAVFATSDCVDGLMLDFYAAPEASVDLTCLDDYPAFRFKGPLDFGDVAAFGVDPVTWTPLCLWKGVRNAENPSSVSAGISATDRGAPSGWSPA